MILLIGIFPGIFSSKEIPETNQGLAIPAGSEITRIEEDFYADFSEEEFGRMNLYVFEEGIYACVIQKGEAEYRYLHLPKGRIELPFSEGDGVYQIKFAKCRMNQNYRILKRMEKEITLREANQPFLQSNYYVNYNDQVSFASLIPQMEGETAEETIRNIGAWVSENISYDYFRENEILLEGQGISQNVPDPKTTFIKRKGICLDQAALAAAMLRLSGIPAKLVFGDHNQEYHAWVEAWDGEKWVIVDPSKGVMGDLRDYKRQRVF